MKKPCCECAHLLKLFQLKWFMKAQAGENLHVCKSCWFKLDYGTILGSTWEDYAH